MVEDFYFFYFYLIISNCCGFLRQRQCRTFTEKLQNRRQLPNCCTDKDVMNTVVNMICNSLIIIILKLRCQSLYALNCINLIICNETNLNLIFQFYFVQIWFVESLLCISSISYVLGILRLFPLDYLFCYFLHIYCQVSHLIFLTIKSVSLT